MTRQASGGGLEELRSIFQRLDRNGDGDISIREFIIAIRKDKALASWLNLASSSVKQEDGSRDTVERLFQNIDKDGDRSISWTEFLAHFRDHVHANKSSPPKPAARKTAGGGSTGAAAGGAGRAGGRASSRPSASSYHRTDSGGGAAAAEAQGLRLAVAELQAEVAALNQILANAQAQSKKQQDDYAAVVEIFGR